MFGLAGDTDLNFLLNQELSQVCIGAHDLILHFDESVSIYIESSISLSHQSTNRIVFEKFSTAATRIAELIGSKIVSAVAIAPVTLKLEFSTGDVLEIFDDSESAESFRLRHGDREIIV